MLLVWWMSTGHNVMSAVTLSSAVMFFFSTSCHFCNSGSDECVALFQFVSCERIEAFEAVSQTCIVVAITHWCVVEVYLLSCWKAWWNFSQAIYNGTYGTVFLFWRLKWTLRGLVNKATPERTLISCFNVNLFHLHFVWWFCTTAPSNVNPFTFTWRYAIQRM